MTIDELKNGGESMNSQTEMNEKVVNQDSTRIQKSNSSTVKEFNPEDYGFKPKVKDGGKDDIDRSYDLIDQYAQQKQKEMQEFNDYIEEVGEITEEEWLAHQKKDYITDELGPKQIGDTAKVIQEKLPERPQDKMDMLDEFNEDFKDDNDISMDLDAEEDDLLGDDDDEEYTIPPVEEVQSSVNYIYTSPIDDVESSIPDDIDTEDFSELIDEDDIIEDNDDDETVDEELLEKEKDRRIAECLKGKLKPVTEAFDFSSYVIDDNRPVSVASTINQSLEHDKTVAKWALLHSRRSISMISFTGSEVEKLIVPLILAEGQKRDLTYSELITIWKIIYSHVADKDKPQKFETWLKLTNFRDEDSIWMAVYRSCFDGSNYYPFYCKTKNCPNAWITENLDIVKDIISFDNDKTKKEFYDLINKEPDYSDAYKKELVPLSDIYAISLKSPSMYDVHIMPNLLGDEFVNKYSDLVVSCMYIDNIYYIDKVNHKLRPINIKTFPNDDRKTVIHRTKQIIKIIQTLDADQKQLLKRYKDKIDSDEEDKIINYTIPGQVCPVCHKRAEDIQVNPRNMVFTRLQLVAMATS